MSQEYRELLIGCGNSRVKKFDCDEKGAEWHNLITLDIDPSCVPIILHDLNVLPYPIDDNYFDEIHAYDVLEHCGMPGDYEFFFSQFAEFWRILKPDGLLCATVPHYFSPWAWGDPGHTRVINDCSLVFLSQEQYAMQVGKTQMTDYRAFYKADFEIVMSEYTNDLRFVFAIRAKKGERK